VLSVVLCNRSLAGPGDGPDFDPSLLTRGVCEGVRRHVGAVSRDAGERQVNWAMRW
jgi:hypothetical protein